MHLMFKVLLFQNMQKELKIILKMLGNMQVQDLIVEFS